MNESPSINANSAPPPPVFPPGHAQPVVGVVMLDTRFPRPPGDVGHPDSWAAPVNFRIVRGVWPDKVVQSARGLRAGRVVPAFVAVVRGLEQLGVSVITTSCGFLVLLQKELQAAVKVPVVTSSLLQLPRLLREERQVGVLTISAGKLGSEHIRSAGVPRERVADVLVQGVNPAGEFASAILGNREQMDLQAAQADVVAAALALKARAPQLQTLLLECTNMPPYAVQIREATGWRVLSLLDAPALRPHAAPCVLATGRTGVSP
ncbi:MAG: aspartate/glutamate racemase family protein [Ramlibacter sp.]|nr:aspartate/glutamate racemase family protein [Ramlibacter sp.]